MQFDFHGWFWSRCSLLWSRHGFYTVCATMVHFMYKIHLSFLVRVKHGPCEPPRGRCNKIPHPLCTLHALGLGHKENEKQPELFHSFFTFFNVQVHREFIKGLISVSNFYVKCSGVVPRHSNLPP